MPQDFRFNLEETAGAIGDYGTLLPIIVGVAVITEIEMAPMLFFFGLAYILTGLYYRLPVPVEPMKAIGAIAIAGSLSAGEIAGAGFLTGIILLGIGLGGGMKRIKELIPQPIIRGIQLGLALTFFVTALEFIATDMTFGLAAIGIVILFTLLPILDISSLVIFVLGLVAGIYTRGFPGFYSFSWPVLSLPTLSELGSGFIQGALPQLPVTLGNSILATSLLIHDLFKRDVPEGRLATSVGMMCIISSPLGGFPMCHGAGGLAAQYRFGARTGGSNIISGVILLIIAFFFASPALLEIIPYGILGALLFFSGLQLLKSAVKTENYPITVMTGLIGVFNMAAAFIGMMIICWMRDAVNADRTA